MHAAPHRNPEPTETPPTVLVVADEPETRDMIAELLMHHGFRVCGASGGAEAVSMLTERPPPDVVVLDVMMPCISGLHVIAMMTSRVDLGRVPRVIVSAMSIPADVAADPLNRILRKPFAADELIAATRDALGSSIRA